MDNYMAVRKFFEAFLSIKEKENAGNSLCCVLCGSGDVLCDALRSQG